MLEFSILGSSQTALAHQPVHVRMILTILLISIGLKQLLDCLILPKMAFSMSVYRGTIFSGVSVTMVTRVEQYHSKVGQPRCLYFHIYKTSFTISYFLYSYIDFSTDVSHLLNIRA